MQEITVAQLMNVLLKMPQTYRVFVACGITGDLDTPHSVVVSEKAESVCIISQAMHEEGMQRGMTEVRTDN